MGEREGVTVELQPAPVGSVVDTVEQLAEPYRSPGRVAAAEKPTALDEVTVGFVASAPFVLERSDDADLPADQRY